MAAAFELQPSLHDLQLRRAGYVEGRGGSRSRVLLRLAVGSGLTLDQDEPFHDAHVRPAGPEEAAAWLARTRSDRAVLTVENCCWYRACSPIWTVAA